MDLQKSTLNQSEVSLLLAKHVITAHAEDANAVISPLSIQILLGMIANGSNGPTRDQLLGFLKSKSTQELNSLSSEVLTRVFADGEPLGGPRLSLANSVWVDRSLTLKPAFREIVHNAYVAASDHVNFRTKGDEARNKVNRWGEEETNGIIKEILPPGTVTPDTRLIFANAMCFKGVWKKIFDSSLTKERDFYLLNGSSVKAPFMSSDDRQYIREFDGFKVWWLPYKQGEDRDRSFSMCIFLPDAKDGLPALLEKVSSESRFIESHLPNHPVQVGDFRIPKFKTGFNFEATKVVKGLGVVLPFCMGNLTEMVDSTNDGKELFVSGIFQKAFIEVNEQGTKAEAVSAVMLGGGCPEKLDFVADHPFLFVVREDWSGVVLFIGQLLNPIA
ncbi:hypothetical protein ABFX02_03G050000 [Erythranthe guttata]